MKITLKDGSFKEYANGMAIIDIAKDISNNHTGIGIINITNIIIMAKANIRSPRLAELKNISLNEAPKAFAFVGCFAI